MVFLVNLIFVIIFSSCVGLFAVENYEYFGQFQSLKGYTGYISNPSSEILNKKSISFGLNKFNIGITYGVFKNFETGVSFDLKQLTPITALDWENLKRKSEEFSFHSKLMLVDEDDYGFNFTVGHRRAALYCVIGKYLPQLYDITLELGVDIRYWTLPGDKFKSFFSFLQTQSGHRFIFAFEDIKSSVSFGWRFLLSPEVAMDVFLVDALRYKAFFENVYYGVSIVWQ